MVHLVNESDLSAKSHFQIKSYSHEIEPKDLIGWTFDRYRLSYEISRSNQQNNLYPQFRFVSAESENQRMGLLMVEQTEYSFTIHSIFVLKAWRRKGIATAILKTFIHQQSEQNNKLPMDANFVEESGNRHVIRLSLIHI